MPSARAPGTPRHPLRSGREGSHRDQRRHTSGHPCRGRGQRTLSSRRSLNARGDREGPVSSAPIWAGARPSLARLPRSWPRRLARGRAATGEPKGPAHIGESMRAIPAACAAASQLRTPCEPCDRGRLRHDGHVRCQHAGPEHPGGQLLEHQATGVPRGSDRNYNEPWTTSPSSRAQPRTSIE